jgi:hypothetical protein
MDAIPVSWVRGGGKKAEGNQGGVPATLSLPKALRRSRLWGRYHNLRALRPLITTDKVELGVRFGHPHTAGVQTPRWTNSSAAAQRARTGPAARSTQALDATDATLAKGRPSLDRDRSPADL